MVKMFKKISRCIQSTKIKINNLNRFLTTNEIEIVIKKKSLPTETSPGQDRFTVECQQDFKRELIQAISHK